MRLRAGCRLALVVLSVFLSAPSLFALDPGRPLRQLHHDLWTTDDGLPQSSGVDLAQTADGLLWIATEDGLARYDGFEFKVFDAQTTPALGTSMISSLLAARDGGLWIGTTDSGLARLHHGVFSRYGAEHALPFRMVSKLAEDSQALWLGSYGNGVARIAHAGGPTRVWTEKDGLPSGMISALLPDGQGGIWVGTDHGLAHLANGRVSPVPSTPELPPCKVGSLLKDGAGGFWIGGTGRLVHRDRAGRLTAYTEREGLPGLSVIALRLDRDGSLWLGTELGVARMIGSRFELFTPKDGLSAEMVHAILEDREGNIWVGTDTGGIDRFRDAPFQTLGVADGLPGPEVTTVFEDRRGALWVGGSRGGMARLFQTAQSAEVRRRYGPRDGLPSDEVYSFAETADGSLWIALFDGGVARLRDGRFTVFGQREGMPSPHVLSLFADRDGAVWAGSSAGLARIADDQITVFTIRDGLSNSIVLNLAEGADGTLWLGTADGLCRRRNGRIEVEPAGRGLGLVTALREDASGTLWIGTESHGLNRLSAGRLRSYTTAQGLPTNIVYSVIDDGLGYLWMSSNKGIVRVAKRQLDEIDRGVRRTLDSDLYGRADGMAAAEGTGGGQPTSWQGRDGRLWFATSKGLAVVTPAALHPNRIPPPVLLDGLVADRRTVPMAAQVRLPPGSGDLEIRYTGLSFRDPEGVRYRYRLVGYDPSWVDAGARRTAFYTRVPPGRYRFQVQAANGDGVWNTRGAGFALELRPHFYQTRTFYALSALAAAGLLFALYRMRLRRMTEGFRVALAERSRIARELHDTLAQDLAAVALHLESVDETLGSAPSEASSYLATARSLVRGSLERARQSVWGLRPTELARTDLPGALAELGERINRERGVPVEVTVQGDARGLDPAAEAELLRIAQEAVANAVRHGAPRRIRIALRVEAERLLLVVEDDGRGFDVPASAGAARGHFGLTGIRERIARLGGNLALSSAPGEGTRLEASLPRGSGKHAGDEPLRAEGGRRS